MAAAEPSLLRHFPLLLPQNRAKTVYEGFISAQGRDFHLKIVLPKDLQVKNARLLCSWQLRNILNEYHQIVQQRMQHSPDLLSFMIELKMILELALKNTQGACVQPFPPKFCINRLEEIGALGWDKLVYVDNCFSTIKLKAEDASGREHLITVKMKAKSSLANIQSQFLAALESLKMFWDIMDEIDEKTWVLEPQKPTRSATGRRDCTSGKTLGIKLSSNVHLWHPENSLLQNLKDVLEIDFPSRTVLENSDFNMDCGICYAYQLDGAMPDQVCNNAQCGQPFHQKCLYEWLRGLLTSRQSFDVLFGECPYCSKPITLKMSARKP